jgi:hypothetical protein
MLCYIPKIRDDLREGASFESSTTTSHFSASGIGASETGSDDDSRLILFFSLGQLSSPEDSFRFNDGFSSESESLGSDLTIIFRAN